MCAMPRDIKAAEEASALPGLTEDVTGISPGEMGRFIQPAAEMLAQTDWDLLPKILATGLATRLVIEERAKEIAERATAILNEARKRI